jgi:RNA polymerase sigma-70 factor (ECF subfamily)
MRPEGTTDADDRRLLAAIAAGDAAAFQAFYRRYSRIVYTLALRITGQDHDAEDVVTDVFWELWDKSARYSPSKSTAYTYLMMLTRCRALDRKRGLSRREAAGILDWAADDDRRLDFSTPSPPELLGAIESRELVARALDELDPNLKRVLEMTFLDGLTHKSAAEQLQIPLGTLKGRIRTALDRLRKALVQVRQGD